MTQSDITQAILIHMALRGFATPQSVAAVFCVGVEAADMVFEGLRQDAQIKPVPLGWRLTRQGTARARDIRQRECDSLQAAMIAALATTLDAEEAALKAAFSDWKMTKTPTGPAPNRHDDRGHDQRIIGHVAAVFDRVAPGVAALALSLGRFGHYGRRLAFASGQIASGHKSFVVGDSVDSCEAIWLELREDLKQLQLLRA